MIIQYIKFISYHAHVFHALGPLYILIHILSIIYHCVLSSSKIKIVINN